MKLILLIEFYAKKETVTKTFIIILIYSYKIYCIKHIIHLYFFILFKLNTVILLHIQLLNRKYFGILKRFRPYFGTLVSERILFNERFGTRTVLKMFLELFLFLKSFSQF